jgi:pimeloyl-ACP methyl ester carboxylesterase
MLIGHSRGSVVAFHWACKSEDGRRISALVNVSGRYRMSVSKICLLTLNRFHLISFGRINPYSGSMVGSHRPDNINLYQIH